MMRKSSYNNIMTKFKVLFICTGVGIIGISMRPHVAHYYLLIKIEQYHAATPYLGHYQYFSFNFH